MQTLEDTVGRMAEQLSLVLNGLQLQESRVNGRMEEQELKIATVMSELSEQSKKMNALLEKMSAPVVPKVEGATVAAEEFRIPNVL